MISFLTSVVWKSILLKILTSAFKQTGHLMLSSLICITCTVFNRLYSSIHNEKSLFIGFCLPALFLFTGCEEGVTKTPPPTENSITAEIDLDHSAEIMAVLSAEAPQAYWGEEGAESLVFEVEVDERAIGDFVLPGVRRTLEHRLCLGTYSSGTHQVKLIYDEENSPAAFNGFTVDYFELRAIEKDDPEYSMFANSPSIYTFQLDGLRDKPYSSYNDLPVSLSARIERNDDGEIIALDYFMLTSDTDGRHDLEPSDQISKYGYPFSVDPVLRVQFDENREIERFYFDAGGHLQQLAETVSGDGHVALAVVDINNDVASFQSSNSRRSRHLYPAASSNVADDDDDTDTPDPGYTVSANALHLFPAVTTSIAADDPSGTAAVNVAAPFILSDLEMVRQGLDNASLSPNSAYPSQSSNYLRIAYEIEAGPDTIFYFQANLLNGEQYRSYFDDMPGINQSGDAATAIELPGSTSSDLIETVAVGINTNQSATSGWLLLKKAVVYRVLEDYSFEIMAEFTGEIFLDTELASRPIFCRGQNSASCDVPGYFKQSATRNQ